MKKKTKNLKGGACSPVNSKEHRARERFDISRIFCATRARLGASVISSRVKFYLFIFLLVRETNAPYEESLKFFARSLARSRALNVSSKSRDETIRGRSGVAGYWKSIRSGARRTWVHVWRVRVYIDCPPPPFPCLPRTPRRPIWMERIFHIGFESSGF